MTCVEGAWTQPRIDCANKKDQGVAVWVGMDGFKSETTGVNAQRRAIQVGTAVVCENGRAFHWAWHHVIPHDDVWVEFASLTVLPGDHMWAMVRETPDGFEMRIENRTRGVSASVVQEVDRVPQRLADWIVDTISTCDPDCQTWRLADFEEIVLTGAATIDGRRSPIDARGTTADRIVMERGGRIRAKVSGLRDGGTTFTVTWVRG